VEGGRRLLGGDDTGKLLRVYLSRVDPMLVRRGVPKGAAAVAHDQIAGL
jgi:hypothetical protein